MSSKENDTTPLQQIDDSEYEEDLKLYQNTRFQRRVHSISTTKSVKASPARSSIDIKEFKRLQAEIRSSKSTTVELSSSPGTTFSLSNTPGSPVVGQDTTPTAHSRQISRSSIQSEDSRTDSPNTHIYHNEPINEKEIQNIPKDDSPWIECIENTTNRTVYYNKITYYYFQYYANKLSKSLSDIQYHLGLYLLEYSLLNVNICSYKPSIVAAAALYLTRYLTSEQTVWNNELYGITNYKGTELIEYVSILHENLRSLNSTSLKTKYSTSKRFRISKMSFRELK